MDFRSIPGRAFLLTLLLSTAVVGCGKRGAGDEAVGSASSGTSTSGSTGTAESTGSGAAASAGAAIDDSVITTKLKTAFVADTTLKGSDISVETRNGEVLLTGSVATAAQKDHAAKIAQAINGVKNVNNKLAMKK